MKLQMKLQQHITDLYGIIEDINMPSVCESKYICILKNDPINRKKLTDVFLMIHEKKKLATKRLNHFTESMSDLETAIFALKNLSKLIKR